MPPACAVADQGRVRRLSRFPNRACRAAVPARYWNAWPERCRVSMRWWLALAFAAIAALTALSVAEVFNNRAERALREPGREPRRRPDELGRAHALGRARAAARPRTSWPRSPTGSRSRSGSSPATGRCVTSDVSRGAVFENVPQARRRLRATLAQGRQVRVVNGGEAYVVGLPLRDRGGAVVTFIRRPELQAQLGIVHDQILRAALLAVLIGALVGLLVASLIAARLRRIARAAAEIEGGAFDTPLSSGFRDELGSLAETIDGMRIHLRSSFRDLEAQRDRLRQLLEGLHEGVIALDSELRIVFWNAAARSLLAGAPARGGRAAAGPVARLPAADVRRRALRRHRRAAGARRLRRPHLRAHRHPRPSRHDRRDPRRRRHLGARAPRARRARVRHERGARARHAADRDPGLARGARRRARRTTRSSATASSR